MGSSCRDQQTSGVLRKPINRQQKKKKKRLELRNQLDTIIHRQIIKPRKEIHKSQSNPISRNQNRGLHNQLDTRINQQVSIDKSSIMIDYQKTTKTLKGIDFGSDTEYQQKIDDKLGKSQSQRREV